MEFIERKDFIGSVSDVDAKGMVVTGFLSSFGNKDHDGDIIEKGAYSKSLKERKNQIFFLNHHEWKQPHGFFNVLEERNEGLYFESNPFVKGVTYSEDTIKLYEAGIIKEHSIGFNVVQSYQDKSRDARILKELFLWEGSNVTLGANSNTPFTGFKSTIKTKEELDQEYRTFIKAYRNGTFTDETFSLLEIAIKDLLQISFELGEKKTLEVDDEPLDSSTQKTITEPLIIDTIKEFTNSLIKK